jgi:hypothetical protein
MTPPDTLPTETQGINWFAPRIDAESRRELLGSSHTNNFLNCVQVRVLATSAFVRPARRA